MNSPSLLIQFDPITWKPTAVFPNGRTDTETAMLDQIADKMIEATRESADDEN